MKKILFVLALAATLGSAGAATISVVTGTGGAPIKLATAAGQPGTALAAGLVKVGWFTDALFTVSNDTKLSVLATKMFFVGGGGAAGVSTLKLNTGGLINGSVTGFNPSATGDVTYAAKQLFLLVADTAQATDLGTASDTVTWALMTVPANTTWNTGVSNTGTKTLSVLTAQNVAGGAGLLHGRFEIDNGAGLATTGIILAPSVPEPASALFFGIAGLLGLVRRRR